MLPSLRGTPRARFIAGGAHPTTYPTETLAELDVDAVCAGEGEPGLLGWLEDPDAPHPGILRRGASDAVQRPRVTDIDGLPDWDRALFGDVTNAGNRYEQAVGVAISRGFCPFTCTFCGIDGYRRLHGQPTAGAMSLRSVDHHPGDAARRSVSVSTASRPGTPSSARPSVSAFCSAYARR